MKANHTILLVILVASYTPCLLAAEVECIDEIDYQKTQDIYTDLFAKYDLPTLSKDFLEAVSTTRDLSNRVDACQKSTNETDLKNCDLLKKQYSDKRIEQDSLSQRFSVAFKMQEYLLTLKLKLERPKCAK